MLEERTDKQVIEEQAQKQILKKVELMRHHLDLIEKTPTDFKYVRQVTKWIQEEAVVMEEFADVALLWTD